ncbi:ALP1-like protein [Tanacetum coccineum]
MVVCSHDMMFTFVYTGWEGTANDSRVFYDAIVRSENKFLIPSGDYFYVADSGYPNLKGFLAPYRGERMEDRADKLFTMDGEDYLEVASENLNIVEEGIPINMTDNDEMAQVRDSIANSLWDHHMSRAVWMLFCAEMCCLDVVFLLKGAVWMLFLAKRARPVKSESLILQLGNTHSPLRATSFISKRRNIPMQERPNLSKTQGASTPEEVKSMYLRNTDMVPVYRGNLENELRVTCYTDEVEYIAAMEAVWMRKFIDGLGVVPTNKEPMEMLCEQSSHI